jgi:hypothetical protein
LIDRRGEGRAVAWGEKEAIFIVMNQFGEGVGISGNNGKGAGHSLHSSQALEIGLRRNNKKIGGAA